MAWTEPSASKSHCLREDLIWKDFLDSGTAMVTGKVAEGTAHMRDSNGHNGILQDKITQDEA